MGRKVTRMIGMGAIQLDENIGEEWNQPLLSRKAVGERRHSEKGTG